MCPTMETRIFILEIASYAREIASAMSLPMAAGLGRLQGRLN
jgi:hypothetical protein